MADDDRLSQQEEERIRRASAQLFGLKDQTPVDLGEGVVRSTSPPRAESTEDDARTEAFMRQYGRRSNLT